MTDRIKALVVILDQDYRTDDVEELITIIQHLKQVKRVDASIVTSSDYMNRRKIKIELIEKILNLIREDGFK